MALTLRSNKGLPLTYEELDNNFLELEAKIIGNEAGVVSVVNGQTGNVLLTTDDIEEGINNRYFTNARLDTALATKTTDSIPEGINLYFTNARARNALSAGTGISYSTSTGEISLAADTTMIPEGINLYYTNSRVDSKLAITNLNIFNDVDYSGTPTTNYVLTWNGNSWVPAAAPGAGGGEANDGENLGTGQGLFATKTGTNLQFYTLAGSGGISISSPSSNVVTFSLASSLTASSISTTSNSNLSLTPNGTGVVVASKLAVSSLTSSRIVYVTTDGRLTDNSELTFASSALTAPILASTVPTGTAPLTVSSSTRVANLNVANAAYADTSGTATSATSATTAATVTTAAQPNITSLGTLTGLASNSNITLNAQSDLRFADADSSNWVSLRAPAIIPSNVQWTLPNSDGISGYALLTYGNGVMYWGQPGTNTGNLTFSTATIGTSGTNENLTLDPNGSGNVTVVGGLTASANITTPVLISNVTTGTAPFTVTSTTQVANLNVATAGTAGTAGTVTTAAQPNITSVGTLTGLVVSNGVSRFTAGVDSGGSLNIGRIDGTASSPYIDFNSGATAVDFDSRIIATGGNGTVGAGTLTITTGSLLVTSPITAPSFVSNVATGTAPFTVTSTTTVANLSVANATYATTAGSTSTAGTVTTAAQPNITSVGTLTGLNVNAQANATVFRSNVATGTAPFVVTSTTTVANLSVANAVYADSALSATTASFATSAGSTSTAGTVTTAAQPNITSLGTLTGLNVNAQANATVFRSTVATGTAPFIVSSTTQVANLNAQFAGSASSATDSTYLGSVLYTNYARTDVAETFSSTLRTTSLGVGTAPGAAGEIRATNEITAYYSDERLKTDIKIISTASEKLKAIKGIYYKNNDLAKKLGFTKEEIQVGVIAQDVASVLPEVIRLAPFDIDADGKSLSGENYLTVKYELLVPLLIEALKEALSRIEVLESKK